MGSFQQALQNFIKVLTQPLNLGPLLDWLGAWLSHKRAEDFRDNVRISMALGARLPWVTPWGWGSLSEQGHRPLSAIVFFENGDTLNPLQEWPKAGF